MTRTSTPLFNGSTGLIFLLMLLWQMPGTIALRNVLLVLLLVCSIVLVKHNPRAFTAHLPRTPLVLLGLLTGWMVLVITGWATSPASSAKEFASQWLIPLLCGFCGLAVAATAVNRHQSTRLAQVVFLGLLVQVVAHDLIMLWFYWGHHAFPPRGAPFLKLAEAASAWATNAPAVDLFESGLFDKFSYVNNTLAALSIAEIAQRLISKKRFLSVNNLWLLVATIAILFCSYTIQTRNGNIGLMVLLLTAAIFIALRVGARIGWARMALVSVVFAGLMSVVSVAFVKSDARWQSLLDTVPIALDTKTNLAWMRQAPYPTLPNGEMVNDSNYDRLAWIKEGVDLIKDQPLGSGYARSAFGDRIVTKYEAATALKGAHSHSGWVDFTIANGLPALAMWLAFLATTLCLGWRGYQAGHMAAGLMLVFLITGFLGRSIVDSTLRDHMLQQFMFLVLAFSVLATPKREAA